MLKLSPIGDEFGLLLVRAKVMKRPAVWRLTTNSECRSYLRVLEEDQLLTLAPVFGDELGTDGYKTVP